MFAEMLTHSEEIIFLEAIDHQYFESNTDFEIDSLKDESDECLKKINLNICDLLNKENDSVEEIYEESSSHNSKVFIPKKYLIMNDYININKKAIDDLKEKIYLIYKSQIKQ